MTGSPEFDKIRDLYYGSRILNVKRVLIRVIINTYIISILKISRLISNFKLEKPTPAREILIQRLTLGRKDPNPLHKTIGELSFSLKIVSQNKKSTTFFL